MNFNPVVLAIPMYFILIGIEILIDRFYNTRLYRLNDSLTNVSCGIGQQASGVFLKVISIGVYEFIFTNFSLFSLDLYFGWWTKFMLVFFLYDLAYYWAHRMSHEINLFWGGHVVHHQSEEFNFSVALRQSWFQTIFTSPFSWPIALLGFDTTTFLLASGLNTVYQFWIHTEYIGKLGPVEWVMNTPSHHRVHHGRNPKYIDKNHAGVFIIWDRMFGTFQEEEEAPVYGITTPTNSWNPIWVQFSHFYTVWNEVKIMPDVSSKIGVLFHKPGWRPASLGGQQYAPEVDRTHYHKFDTQSPISVNWYVFFQYSLTFVGSAFFAFSQENWDWTTRILVVTLLCWGILNAGGLFESRKWIYRLEYLRLIFTSGLIAFLLFNTEWFNLIVVSSSAVIFISFVWLFLIRNNFQEKPTLQSA